MKLTASDRTSLIRLALELRKGYIKKKGSVDRKASGNFEEAQVNLTASDRKALIRLASSLPKGSSERKTILAGLKTSSGIRRSGRPGSYEWSIKVKLRRPVDTHFGSYDDWAEVTGHREGYEIELWAEDGNSETVYLTDEDNLAMQEDLEGYIAQGLGNIEKDLLRGGELPEGFESL